MPGVTMGTGLAQRAQGAGVLVSMGRARCGVKWCVGRASGTHILPAPFPSDLPSSHTDDSHTPNGFSNKVTAKENAVCAWK